MKSHIIQSSWHRSGSLFASSSMTGALTWWSDRRREWRIARARRQAYSEIALLSESLRIDLTSRHQEM